MSDCKSYVSKEDLQALKESQQHIEHVARSRNAAGEKALQVTDSIRGENVTNRTLDGLEDLYTSSINNFETRGEEALRSVGWVTIDSFQQGAEITERNQVLRDETNGEYYRWDGDLPKNVPVSSTPESAGGVGMGAWVSVGDASLRSDLSKSTGANIIGTESGKSVQDELKTITNMSDALISSKYSMHGAGKSLGAENTVVSCSLLNSYFDVIDVDISTTSDGVAILMHDTNTTPLEGISGNIVDYTYDQIKDKKNLLFNNTPFDGTTVTTWDSFMLFCANRGKRVTAELKNTQGTSESMMSIYNPIVNRNMIGKINLQCLNIQRLKDYRNITGDNVTQLLTLVYDGMPNEDLDYVLSETLSLGNSGLNVDINYSKLDELIMKAKQKKIIVNFWTAKQYSDEISVLSRFPGHQLAIDYMVV